MVIALFPQETVIFYAICQIGGVIVSRPAYEHVVNITMYSDIAIGPSFSDNRRKMLMSFLRLALTSYLCPFCKLTPLTLSVPY
jgi:hypothetical protein